MNERKGVRVQVDQTCTMRLISKQLSNECDMKVKMEGKATQGLTRMSVCFDSETCQCPECWQKRADTLREIARREKEEKFALQRTKAKDNFKDTQTFRRSTMHEALKGLKGKEGCGKDE